MATPAYMTGRRKYSRPQAVLWSNNPGTLVNGLYVPNGYEVGQDPGLETDSSVLDQFLILSDHNRGEIKVWFLWKNDTKPIVVILTSRWPLVEKSCF